jgi:uncharacterized RmlC-like cupin family protein
MIKKQRKMKGRLKMKKWYLVIIVLAVILSVMSCNVFKSRKPIHPAAMSEIYALSGARAWLYGKYVEVKAVEDRSDYCYIMIYIKSLPGEATTLKDALDQAKVFTRTFIESTVKILNQYDINKDVSVWAQLLLKDGEVNVLGHTRYEVKKHTFHDFEQYGPDKKNT